MAGWNKNIKSPQPPVEIEKDLRLVNPEKKVKEYPSELKRMTAKVYKQTDLVVTQLKEKNRYPKIEIYDKAVYLYSMIDEVIPEFSGQSKAQVIKQLLTNLEKYESAVVFYDIVSEAFPDKSQSERKECIKKLISEQKK